MYKKYPHRADNLPAAEALASEDEETFDLSQEIGRIRWRSGGVSCLTQNAHPWLRFRKRYCNGAEKMRLHVWWGLPDRQWWHSHSDHQLSELAALGYNTFITGLLFLALCVLPCVGPAIVFRVVVCCWNCAGPDYCEFHIDVVINISQVRARRSWFAVGCMAVIFPISYL